MPNLLKPTFFRRRDLSILAVRAAKKKGLRLFGSGFAIGKYMFILAKVERQ